MPKTKKYSLREDPDARKLLADLQALLERAEALSKKADHESKTTGHLWGVCGYLTNAVARAEDDILHLCEFCGDLVRDEKGNFHQKCYDAAAAEPPLGPANNPLSDTESLVS